MQVSIKRPVIIRIICYLGFAGIAFSFISVFSPFVKKMGDWYPALFGLLVAGRFMAYIGLWHMKRWGVQMFIVTFFFNEILLVLTNSPNYISTFFSVLFMIPMFIYYKRMDLNL